MKKLLLILPIVLNVMLAGCSPAKTETGESNKITTAISNSESSQVSQSTNPFDDLTEMQLDTNYYIQANQTNEYKFKLVANTAYTLRRIQGSSYVTTFKEDGSIFTDEILLSSIRTSISLNSPSTMYIKISFENTYTATAQTANFLIELS